MNVCHFFNISEIYKAGEIDIELDEQRLNVFIEEELPKWDLQD